jgi:hypothetical protein
LGITGLRDVMENELPADADTTLIYTTLPPAVNSYVPDAVANESVSPPVKLLFTLKRTSDVAIRVML